MGALIWALSRLDPADHLGLASPSGFCSRLSIYLGGCMELAGEARSLPAYPPAGRPPKGSKGVPLTKETQWEKTKKQEEGQRERDKDEKKEASVLSNSTSSLPSGVALQTVKKHQNEQANFTRAPADLQNRKDDLAMTNDKNNIYTRKDHSQAKNKNTDDDDGDTTAAAAPLVFEKSPVAASVPSLHLKTWGESPGWASLQLLQAFARLRTPTQQMLLVHSVFQSPRLLCGVEPSRLRQLLAHLLQIMERRHAGSRNGTKRQTEGGGRGAAGTDSSSGPSGSAPVKSGKRKDDVSMHLEAGDFNSTNKPAKEFEMETIKYSSIGIPVIDAGCLLASSSTPSLSPSSSFSFASSSSSSSSSSYSSSPSSCPVPNELLLDKSPSPDLFRVALPSRFVDLLALEVLRILQSISAPLLPPSASSPHPQSEPIDYSSLAAAADAGRLISLASPQCSCELQETTSAIILNISNIVLQHKHLLQRNLALLTLATEIFAFYSPFTTLDAHAQGAILLLIPQIVKTLNAGGTSVVGSTQVLSGHQPVALLRRLGQSFWKLKNTLHQPSQQLMQIHPHMENWGDVDINISLPLHMDKGGKEKTKVADGANNITENRTDSQNRILDIPTKNSSFRTLSLSSAL
eukprot:GHVT01030372.1.p1 GENE.GHVT01030372.1~~GHVT01030372.1.p1  ORF type:complete len:738 (+),score=164.14 GHVT01030372.1:320-2215(+)